MNTETPEQQNKRLMIPQENDVEKMDAQDVIDSDLDMVNDSGGGDITNIEDLPTSEIIRANPPLFTGNNNSIENAQSTPPMQVEQQFSQVESDENNQDVDMAEDNSRSEATFQFTVQNISKLKESALSPPCYVRNLPWKIMAMPRTSTERQNLQERQPNKLLGFFLQCNGDSESSSWSCNAIADLRLLSHKTGGESFNRKIQHLFYSKENDWGFSHFMNWNDLMDPEKGYVKDDSITLEVKVNADAPHGVSWDSKKHTGYVGLKNQGATCYMNSLLQTLYFTNQLRKAVYKMPTEADDSAKSVALALQRVFNDLQFSDKPVGTKKLTKSFGWETLDSFMQHDVQEFLRVLLDKIESKMKGTCVEGTVPKLFEGKMVSYIKCKDVIYTSERTETFYDIQLNIKGKKNIDESFEDYVASEMLDGDNKYDAGEYGLQDAEKGVIFQSFPPVLHLHLMRFQYDPITDCSVKFNDKFEFYEHIKLDKYLQQPEATPAEYTLHAVLVHSGDNHGGHYVVFLNPRGDGKWCKFDDDVVARCSKAEAIEHNYGGHDEDLNMTVKHCTNAYMLVYIRNSELKNVLQEVTEADIPTELVERLQEEKRLEIIRRKERTESYLYMTVNVLLEDAFDGHQGYDLCELDRAPYRSFRVKKTSIISDLKETLADTFHYPPEQIRLWPIIPRSNDTNRPIFLDIEADADKTVADLSDNQNPYNIWLELLPADSNLISLPTFDHDNEVLLFFKYYDAKLKKIFYCGHLYLPFSIKMNEIIPNLIKKANLPPNTRITIYEEIKPQNTQIITKLDEPIEKCLEELMDGDIIVFEKEYHNLSHQHHYHNYHHTDDVNMSSNNIYGSGLIASPQQNRLGFNDELPTCKDYFKDLESRVEVTFIDKNIPNDPGFTIELSLGMTYDQIARNVAQRVGTDPYLLQFFKCQSLKEMPGLAVRCNIDLTLKEILLHSKAKVPKKMFYQQLSVRINELEDKVQFKVTWVGSKMKEEREMMLYPNKDSKISELLDEAKKQVDLSANENGSGKLRIFEVSSYKIMSLPYKGDITIDTIQLQMKTYRIEEIPKDELNLNDNEMLVPCVHFNKDIYQVFGIPFFIKIVHNEPFSLLKERIQKKLSVSEKEWEKYKVAIVSNTQVQYIPDEKLITLDEFKSTLNQRQFVTWIGLEHINKAPKRSRINYLEKAIKIYN